MYDLSNDWLLKEATPPQLLIEIALWNIFHNAVHLILVIEICKQLRDIWMTPESILNFKFFLHLSVEIILVKLVFEDRLDCNLCSRLGMDSRVDLSELALANLLQLREVIETQLLSEVLGVLTIVI